MVAFQKYGIVGGLLLFLFSCQTDGKVEETYTSGSTRMVADESFAPIVDDELYVFESLYKRADIDMIYKPENELLNLFLNDSVRIAILSRTLKPEEKRIFDKQNITVRVNRFAVDAIALVTHKSTKDSAVTVEEIVKVMQGNASKISALVFDNPNSSTVRYMMDLAGVKLLPVKGVYALKSNPDIIKYVHNNPGSIGVIGVNWIKQPGKEIAPFVDNLKTLGVKNVPGKPGSDRFYKPSQNNLALGVYPLTRNLYIINCQGGPGLGWGFASFLASDRGQRIVLKSGLLPDSIPPREILIKK